MNDNKIYHLVKRLYPICRSITGNGVRQTLQILSEYIPLSVHEVPTGTTVFDWTVPKEWNIKVAWIKDSHGNTIVDFNNHNLHVLNYSTPIHEKMTLEELQPHLFSLPDQPDLIPYRTSYYQENWGFCLSHHQLENLDEGVYEVFIESTLNDGYLTYGEYFIKGKSEDEMLISTHICHPSLANDNLSGISIVTHLAKHLSEQKNHYSYRFLFVPGTIGAITWLALNEPKTKNIKHGLVAALLGDNGAFTYKKSRQGNTEIDQTVESILSEMEIEHKIINFYPYGYDERQFCSPAFNLPLGNLGRTPYGQFPEYHTSADNLEFINATNLNQSYEVYQKIIERLEYNYQHSHNYPTPQPSFCDSNEVYYINLFPKCEPQLGKRGLYSAIGGNNDQRNRQMAMLWILNYSDGEHHLNQIAQMSNIDPQTIYDIATILEKEQLLEKVSIHKNTLV